MRESGGDSAGTRHVEHIVLVPGFLSSSWLLAPLARYLKRHRAETAIWDYPKAFGHPDMLATRFAEHLRATADRRRTIAIVTHSFGDWIARQALTRCSPPVTHVVSICPVVEPVPLARCARRFLGDLNPQLTTMASPLHSHAAWPLPDPITHLVLWARWDFITQRPPPRPAGAVHLELAGTHNTILFRPVLWRTVLDQLCPNGRTDARPG